MQLTHYTDLRAQTTLHLTQTMRLLELNTEELTAEISRELETNPVLQMIDEFRCPDCGRRLRSFPCSACIARHTGEAPIVFLSPRQMVGRGAAVEQDDLPAERIAQAESLADSILRQVACVTSRSDQRIAAYVLERLDERGLLSEPISDIVTALRSSSEDVNRVIELIQRSDPVGVATANCRESLLVQLEVIQESTQTPDLCEPILKECWDLLTKRNYQAIARRLKESVERVKESVYFIRRNLTPYPARAWQDTGRGTNRLARDVFYQPDIAITLNPRPDGPLIVEVFSGMAGTLRLDPEIKAVVPSVVDESDRGEWQEYVERATLLVKCVQQRNNTMRRLAEIITTEQMAFILGGDCDLKPLTRSVLARRLCLHESTISRAVSNKSAALPNGRIVPLSIFFDRSLAVRDAVQAIVADEDRGSPFSDTQIAHLLKGQGYNVARRTVAKYRQMKGILPANLRSRELILAG